MYGSMEKSHIALGILRADPWAEHRSAPRSARVPLDPNCAQRQNSPLLKRPTGAS